MFFVDGSPDLRAELDGEKLVSKEGMSLMRYASLKYGERVFQLSYSLAHLRYLSM